MHTLLLLAVEADDEDEVPDAVEAALDRYTNGRLCEHYTIGGHWHGWLSGYNALRYSDDPDKFRIAATDAWQRHLARYNSLRRQVTGETVALADLDERHDFEYGGTQDPEAYVERLNAYNRATADTLAGVLKTSAPPTNTDAALAIHTLMRFAQMANDLLTSQNALWDAERETASPESLLDDMDDPVLAERTWLVVVDLGL